MSLFRLILSYGDDEIIFNGSSPRAKSPYFVTKDEIEGLYSAPAVKTDIQERDTANGGHPVMDADVLYSARTITIPFAISTLDHELVDLSRTKIGRMMGKANVKLTVLDGTQSTYLTGFIRPEYSNIPDTYTDTGKITMICADPYRYSAEASTSWMDASSLSAGGLVFSGANDSLQFPMNYGVSDTASNIAKVSNSGNYASWPVITIAGTLSDIILHWRKSTGEEGDIIINGTVNSYAPVTIDTRNSTATIGGMDVSYMISRKSYPSIPPGGDIVFSLLGNGNGGVSVVNRNTWI